MGQKTHESPSMLENGLYLSRWLDCKAYASVRKDKLARRRGEECPGNVVITKLKGFHLVSRELQKKDAKSQRISPKGVQQTK